MTDKEDYFGCGRFVCVFAAADYDFQKQKQDQSREQELEGTCRHHRDREEAPD